MTQQWYDPRDYVDANAKLASGDAYPPMTRQIGFVTQSPGNLFMAAKGLTSTTGELVTKLRSASEIQTSRNEVIQVRNLSTGQASVAIDIGQSANPSSRDLLVLSGTAEPQAVEEDPFAAIEAAAFAAAEAQSLDTGPSQTDVLTGHVTVQHAIAQANQQQTIENATPSQPTQYIAPQNSYVVTSTAYVAPAPAPEPYYPQGSYIVNDYEAYLLGGGLG